MNNTLKTSLVLCDLDHLLLGTDGNLPQVLRDVMQLFSSRGGRLTVFSQRSPRAVRTILGSVRLAAPALVCGGTLAYQFATGTGQPLCSFAGREEAVLQKLPSAVGLGIALQMTDGSTRVLRMSEALEAHLRQEWTPYVLSSAADVRGEDVLRILLYQDKKQMPLVPLLDKALGEAADSLLAERVTPDLQVVGQLCLRLQNGVRVGRDDEGAAHRSEQSGLPDPPETEFEHAVDEDEQDEYADD